MELSRNKTITQAFIEKHIGRGMDVDWYDLSMNPNISIDFLLKHKHEALYWGLHPNITIDLVLAHQGWLWNWRKLSSHPRIMEDLSYNPNITMEVVLANRNKSWLWYGLTQYNHG